MFSTEYSVLGSTLQGRICPCSVTVTKEHDYYAVIRRAAEAKNWLYNRLETTDKRGMPDIIVTRGPEYWFIEVKRLRKKKLVTIEDDLTWQFGQLAFMKNCYRNRSRYILIVVKEKTALILKGAYPDEHANYPDFAELL